MGKPLKVGDQAVEVSHPDKLSYPASGITITKGKVVEYYRRIAPAMLPYLQDRPLVLQRFPDGVGGFRFYQKSVPEHYPSWIGRVQVERLDP